MSIEKIPSETVGPEEPTEEIFGQEGKEKKIESQATIETIVATLEQAYEQGADKYDVARGLVGIGTKESMELRERLLKDGGRFIKDSVAEGLAGVGTKEAMDLRERLIRERVLEEGADKNDVARGLVGIGTKESMELRERLLERLIKDGVSRNSVAEGLAGVGTKEAMEFREKHFGDNPTLMAKSYSTSRTVLNGVICCYGFEN